MASPTQIGISGSANEERRPGHLRFFGFSAGAGLLICLLAAFTFLHLPAAHAPTLTALCLRAVLFVVIGCGAGTLGAWYYWKSAATTLSPRPSISFPVFALACAVGWVWVPAVVLLGREDSPLTAITAVLGAVLLGFALRKVIPASAPVAQPPETQLFAATLRTPPLGVRGYVLSLCIFGAGLELFNGWVLDASALLAVTAWLLVWSATMAPADPSAPAAKAQSRAARRLAIVLVSAFLVTLFALLHGIGHRNRLEREAAAAAGPGRQRTGDDDQDVQAASRNPGSPLSSYHSVILWPVPEKRQILPPLPAQTNFLAPGTTKPLVIRFDGPYYYFQPPAKAPGANAIQAHGTPLAHDLQSNNFIPLIMQAHQDLGTPIPIARCREVQVSILNNDNRPGPINIALLLTDSSQPNNQVYMGQQAVVSSQPGSFAIKTAPAAEVLHFEVPAGAKIRKFDHITVMLFPDSSNYDVGPKVAIKEFQLIPR